MNFYLRRLISDLVSSFNFKILKYVPEASKYVFFQGVPNAKLPGQTLPFTCSTCSHFSFLPSICNGRPLRGSPGPFAVLLLLRSATNLYLMFRVKQMRLSFRSQLPSKVLLTDPELFPPFPIFFWSKITVTTHTFPAILLNKADKTGKGTTLQVGSERET